MIKKYGVIGFIRLSFYLVVSKLMFGFNIRIIKCIPVLINPSNIRISEGFTGGKQLRLESVGKKPGEIIIGQNVTFNDYVHIGAYEKVEIGKNTLVGSRVTIIDHDHGAYNTAKYERSRIATVNIPPANRELFGSPITIGKNCWIGDGAVILAGVSLGEGVVVGANAVVTRSFESGVIIAGSPATIIGTYK